MAECVEDGGDAHSERRVRVLRTDVGGEGVAAEHGRRVVGEGADYGDLPRRRGQRKQTGAVVQQDDGFLGEASREGAILPRVEGDGAGGGVGQYSCGRGLEGRRNRSPVRVEEAEFAL